MKRIVVSGGTDGIGNGVATAYITRGDDVTIIGRSQEKGEVFLKAAAELGASGRASYIQADLSLVSENERVIAELQDRLPFIDGLVMSAQYHRINQVDTPEGFDAFFALFYLSRYLLAHGLVSSLEKAQSPVIVSVAAPRGDLFMAKYPNRAEAMKAAVREFPHRSGVHGFMTQALVDDPQLRKGWDSGTSLAHTGLLNDLLGVGFAERHPDAKTRYVLVHPGLVASARLGDIPNGRYKLSETSGDALTVPEAAAPIVDIIDAPPPRPLTAFLEKDEVSIDHPSFDRDDAIELDRVTQEYLAAPQ